MRLTHKIKFVTIHQLMALASPSSEYLSLAERQDWIYASKSSCTCLYLTCPCTGIDVGQSYNLWPCSKHFKLNFMSTQLWQRRAQISLYNKTTEDGNILPTWDILSRCLASSLSLAFWKWACSFSSPGVSRYLSTASGVLAAVVGTRKETGRQDEKRNRMLNLC